MEKSRVLFKFDLPGIVRRVYERPNSWSSQTTNGRVFGYTWTRQYLRDEFRCGQHFDLAYLTVRVFKFWERCP